MSEKSVPIALTIAGSDPSGGAGIQADLKTFTALGVYGASVITALTAQNTMGVTGVHKVPADFIRAQFEAVAVDLNFNAIKTGMLADEETVNLVSELLLRIKPLHLVVDPVMVATSGDKLLESSAIESMRIRLIPLASLITPNLPEAAELLGADLAQTDAEMVAQARALLGLGCRAVLLKGGHGSGSEAIDYLVTKDEIGRFVRPRIETSNTHGTGCTLAAAITAGLAHGMTLDAAVRQGKDFVWHALHSGAGLAIGHGSGPVDHLFKLR